MFARGFHPSRFLQSVAETEPFREYCRQRAIAFESSPAEGEGTVERWQEALRKLSPDAQARVDLELAQVNELASRDGTAHLLEAAGGGTLPTDDIPEGAALALWFYLNRPEVFQAVFFQHEVSEVHSWRAARTNPGLSLDDLPARAARLGMEMREFFRQTAGAGRFCAVDARTVADAVCFVAQVADRIQLIEGFGDGGEVALQRVRPALTVLFSYSAAEGSVHLKSPVRAVDRVGELFRCFGRSVLGRDVTPAGEAFALDRLKQPMPLVPDADDMEAARVKAVHLQYPARLGRRRVKLETLAGDAPDAIDHLLRTHVGTAGSDLAVCYAEVQVRLRAGGRTKTQTIRLWPDRCNLNHAPLGLRLRSCLRKWGLARA